MAVLFKLIALGAVSGLLGHQIQAASFMDTDAAAKGRQEESQPRPHFLEATTPPPEPMREIGFNFTTHTELAQEAGFLRRLVGCPDMCSGMHCPSPWVAQNQCNRCACVCPPGRTCRRTPARSQCVGVNGGCFIDAQCCSSRCTSVHMCRPTLR